MFSIVFEWDWDHLRIRIYMNLPEKARKPHLCFWLLPGIWRSLTRKDPFPCCPFLQCFCWYGSVPSEQNESCPHTWYVIPKFKSTNFLFYPLPVVDSLCSSLISAHLRKKNDRFFFRLQATRSWILFLETVHISFRAGGGRSSKHKHTRAKSIAITLVFPRWYGCVDCV